ncbi:MULTISPECIES: hypothetical protein [Rhizobium]|uniref:NhaP-type Na+/H+ or K+/H+ antiporter n=1 Tax=Rhizobium wenxiniae TaxID=1737357 RepID=A0A7X0D497_9HYPH|nr:hypothetical protein [Rhizobium wenxiniae]MBB6166286.1 NhaP-type Na+/H+ or K+/H+ antiporter [Rhizobium wenxiniae]GGG23106.1 hypothetical protein GCM10010924_60830 [Rhizobium wenxiniae]
MGAGLKIDRRFSFKGWAIAWRLLLITIPLSIRGTIFKGKGILGVSTMSALLLAASLTPTDPVLAADIQVSAPLEGGEDAIRFALTAEAGLNDDLRFSLSIWRSSPA